MLNDEKNLFLVALCLFLLAAIWIIQLGWRRGGISFICRFLWILPLFLAFFPHSQSEEFSRSLALTQFHVLIDDSKSMRIAGLGASYLSQAENFLGNLRARCQELACELKVDYLSKLNPLTEQGFTPLSSVLPDWLTGFEHQPWLLFSDGEDFRPELSWEALFSERGKNFYPDEGIVVTFGEDSGINVWVEDVNLPPFSFATKSLNGHLNLRRSNSVGQLAVQVQINSEAKIIASYNLTFSPGSDRASIDFDLPGLSKGQHLLTFKVLALAGEKNLWDNQALVDVEVLPDTVGIMHLLGAPSWDGRFLRRFFKSEPKFDLVSFFILRDPWDNAIDERKLSLIPFPVARLFNDELVNFRMLALQNFNLLQFLQPEYQRNLVDFVKNGGGMLFVGGPRSLMAADLNNSPLKEIIPFHSQGSSSRSAFGIPGFGGGGEESRPTKSGPYYDESYEYKIALAKPTTSQRELANLFDDWQQNQDLLESVNGLVGLHHMEKVTFKEGEYTPLLDAVGKDGKKIPLAIASYPGKGRALWLFTDSLWRLAMNPQKDIARDFYHDFYMASMTWLLRQDLKKQLVASQLHLRNEGGDSVNWSARLEGPTLAYFSLDGRWQLSLCQRLLKPEDVHVEKLGDQSLILSGKIAIKLAGGSLCSLSISGQDAAFGSVNTQVTSALTKTYADHELAYTVQKTEELLRVSKANLVTGNDGNAQAKLDAFLLKHDVNKGVKETKNHRVVQNYFWWMDYWWAWLLFLFLPLEVLVRRWQIVS